MIHDDLVLLLIEFKNKMCNEIDHQYHIHFKLIEFSQTITREQMTQITKSKTFK